MPYRLDQKYDTLDRLSKWDEVTRSSIKKRLAEETGTVSVFHYLSAREGRILEIITGILIPQKNGPEHIKIAEAIDRNLNDRKEGVRYGKNPWRGEFYRNGLKLFSGYVNQQLSLPAEKAGRDDLKNIVSQILEGGSDEPLRHFLRKVLSDAIAVYFSHPLSWNGIGFPGPAFPEGYPFLNCNEKEEWEPHYEKYEK
jgi:hypothetical protein